LLIDVSAERTYGKAAL